MKQNKTKHCWLCFFDIFRIELSPFMNIFFRKNYKFDHSKITIIVYFKVTNKTHLGRSNTIVIHKTNVLIIFRNIVFNCDIVIL